MNNPDKTIIEAISFFEHNTDNLTPEQLGNIRKLINAYADLNNKTTDVISRRNMQIKDLKEKIQAYKTMLQFSHTDYNEKTEAAEKIINR